ncbi:GntR family transcriptional regulator/MocR family aminotransferase [Chitinophaga polysaccharea]|uniref:GntR family transcriptional regulator/MocR family aminotransferase n=1 Tax=Chitinophaga polysaccharea TaxID=1293035 RepID=A0A561PUG3_9BACT|nr:PLP-dependent aminotransferase family protein [Chitinophaga polysaccharea]TWF41753.1 GntR family transcriptional regulator/MocR family aminotransferase [Chitinophaga polysaccharea]
MLRAWKLEVQLDEQSDKAIYLQVADAIIKDIHSGRLKSGDALPGSRYLSQQLKLNRNTIVEALNVLLIEGWLESRERRGTFVAATYPFHPDASKKGVKPTAAPSTKPWRIFFDDGYPDSKIAPIAELARAYRQIFNRKAKWQMMGYGTELGDLEFRKEMAQMLNHQRGMSIQAQMLCITRGSQMALYLVAQTLLEKGDYIMIENPGYKPAWKAFESTGAKLLPVNVDEEGLVITDVIRHLKSRKKIRAIYLTPHRQYPTTVTLSLQRRLKLVELSNEYGFTIVEDDYDNEFHFGYRPVLPLSTFAELKQYVYIGTMSKVVAPALRIGYLASSNQQLLDKVAALRKIIDVQGDNIMEQAVLQLIKDGTIKRHIKKASLHYKARRDAAEVLLQKYLKHKATWHVPDGGLAFWIVPKAPVDWFLISERLQAKGIKIICPDSYSYDAPVNGIRLGYASPGEEQLEEGIQALAKLL